jgi:hypothetical protein
LIIQQSQKNIAMAPSLNARRAHINLASGIGLKPLRVGLKMVQESTNISWQIYQLGEKSASIKI